MNLIALKTNLSFYFFLRGSGVGRKAFEKNYVIKRAFKATLKLLQSDSPANYTINQKIKRKKIQETPNLALFLLFPSQKGESAFDSKNQIFLNTKR